MPVRVSLITDLLLLPDIELLIFFSSQFLPHKLPNRCLLLPHRQTHFPIRSRGNALSGRAEGTLLWLCETNHNLLDCGDQGGFGLTPSVATRPLDNRQGGWVGAQSRALGESLLAFDVTLGAHGPQSDQLIHRDLLRVPPTYRPRNHQETVTANRSPMRKTAVWTAASLVGLTGFEPATS